MVAANDTKALANGNATARRFSCLWRARRRRAAGPWVYQSRLQSRRSAKPPARQMRARGCWPAQRRRASRAPSLALPTTRDVLIGCCGRSAVDDSPKCGLCSGPAPLPLCPPASPGPRRSYTAADGTRRPRRPARAPSGGEPPVTSKARGNRYHSDCGRQKGDSPCRGVRRACPTSIRVVSRQRT